MKAFEVGRDGSCARKILDALGMTDGTNERIAKMDVSEGYLYEVAHIGERLAASLGPEALVIVRTATS